MEQGKVCSGLFTLGRKDKDSLKFKTREKVAGRFARLKILMLKYRYG
jgi:hypothetical protein